MKSFATTLTLLALPFVALAAPSPSDPSSVTSFIAVASYFDTHSGPAMGGTSLTERDEIFSYEKCLDDCISWATVGPCNPMNLCDPGLGCALGGPSSLVEEGFCTFVQ
ncbi:hypothetical protein B0T14DRAFT_500449 [Immersiella caudata]|uniref:Uncharacterized protein n=1 Tax=Immersiella caudata TaxID=314043 RepID=A0AA39WA76_9PEZI|nr:hypothetical protein B0T14DRAFT_500449 [Immersiella caudata]